jgi:hypothetical protein
VGGRGVRRDRRCLPRRAAGTAAPCATPGPAPSRHPAAPAVPAARARPGRPPVPRSRAGPRPAALTPAAPPGGPPGRCARPLTSRTPDSSPIPATEGGQAGQDKGTAGRSARHAAGLPAGSPAAVCLSRLSRRTAGSVVLRPLRPPGQRAAMAGAGPPARLQPHRLRRRHPIRPAGHRGHLLVRHRRPRTGRPLLVCTCAGIRGLDGRRTAYQRVGGWADIAAAAPGTRPSPPGSTSWPRSGRPRKPAPRTGPVPAPLVRHREQAARDGTEAGARSLAERQAGMVPGARPRM